MRKLIILLLITIMSVGCSKLKEKSSDNTLEDSQASSKQTLQIDDVEGYWECRSSEDDILLRIGWKNDIDIYVAPELEGLTEILSQIKELEKHIGEVYNNIQVTLKEKLSLTNEECNEIARTVLPIGQAMSYNIAFNIEGLMRLANVRLCNRAEYPIRTISKMMIDEVIKAEPRYKPYLVPQCIKLGKCPEGKHTCGKLKEMEKLYK